MSNKEFIALMNGLCSDMEVYEALGFAFINLSDDQAYRIIHHYKNLGFAKIERGTHGKYQISFGSKYQYFMFLDDYMEKYNQTPKDIIQFMGL